MCPKAGLGGRPLLARVSSKQAHSGAQPLCRELPAAVGCAVGGFGISDGRIRAQALPTGAGVGDRVGEGETVDAALRSQRFREDLEQRPGPDRLFLLHRVPENKKRHCRQAGEERVLGADDHRGEDHSAVLQEKDRAHFQKQKQVLKEERDLPVLSKQVADREAPVLLSPLAAQEKQPGRSQVVRT